MRSTATPGSPQSETQRSASGGAEERVARRRKVGLVTLQMVSASYALDALLMFCFYLTSAVPLAAFASQVVAGSLISGLTFVLIRRDWSALTDDPYLTLPRTIVGAGFQIWLAMQFPAIAILSITTIFTIFTFGALRLRRRVLVATWFGVLAFVGLAIVNLPPDSSFPHASTAQSLVTTLWLATTIGRCTLVGLYGSSIRSELGRRNRQLTMSKQILETMVSRDGLTGALNHSAILEFLGSTLEARGADGVAVVFLDLDHFKTVNDVYGHPIGDEVLRQFVSLATAGLRPDCRMGRYGGEEFLVVVPGVQSVDAARRIAERIRAAVETWSWEVVAPGLRVTVSAGTALARPNISPLELVRIADLALYAAKTAGRNCVRSDSDTAGAVRAHFQ